MTEENHSNEAAPNALDPDEGRKIVDTQVDLLVRLNDELLRTIRIHAVLGGVIITGISFLGVDAFTIGDTPNDGILIWAIYAILLTLFSFLWLMQLISARVSYTDLRLGVWPETPDTTRATDEKMSKLEAAKILFFPVNQDRFEETHDKEDAKYGLVGSDYATCVEHNNWFLKTREQYINSVQRGLNSTFVLTIMSLLGLIMN